jgi:menaquinone-dependent protoporphyrinogen oxidase
VTPPKVLVAFHSSEGQTERIAEHIGDILQLHGAVVDVVDAEADPAPEDYDGVIVGDSIHVGHHSKSLVRYLKHHASALAGHPNALFQVSMVSANPDAEHTEAAARLVQELRHQTDFAPNEVAMFAGALAYTKYGWLTRRILRSIAAKEGGSTDTSSDHEYTDWAEVEHFADRFFDLVSAPSAPAAPDGFAS